MDVSSPGRDAALQRPVAHTDNEIGKTRDPLVAAG